MKLLITPGLGPEFKEKWEKQFVAVDRNFLESIWRRSEDAEIIDHTLNRRRRIIHVIDKYDMLSNGDGTYDFAITECYMWICSTLPRQELRRYIENFTQALSAGEWLHRHTHWQRGDMRFSYTVTDQHPNDKKAGRDFGNDYQTIECSLTSVNFPMERLTKESPWDVYNSGKRELGVRVPNPRIVTDVRELIQHLPAQIELGGGASLELGIPPLNYFHTVYNIYAQNDKRFAYGDTDALLRKVLPNPEIFYTQKVALPYKNALLAEPNFFYRFMAKLQNKGLIVGSVITNNFDGICSLVNLPEMYVRRYDEQHIVPRIDFPAAAKSLIVIGSHADRRRIQQAAKEQGLAVIYVDPEQYVDHAGNTIPYPLEKIEADDFLVPLQANAFAQQLAAALSLSDPVTISRNPVK